VFSSSVLAVSHRPQVRRLITTSSASRKLVGRFIAGDDLDTAIAPVRALVDRGMLVTVDHLGEDITDLADAAATRAAYVTLLDRLDILGLAHAVEVSVKLSALGQSLPGDGDRIALDHAAAICAAATRAGTTVTLDMEDHTTVDSTLGILADLRREYPWVGAVLQSALRRTEADATDLARAGSRVRLVKGAYAEPASVAYTAKADVDEAYLRCLRILLAGPGYPMVATHDPHDRGRAGHGRRARPQRRRPRVPDALRHPDRRAGPHRGVRRPDARVPALRRRLVRVLHPPPRRAPGEPRLLPPIPAFPLIPPEPLSMDAVTTVPEPANEPVRTYAPGSPERASLLARLRELRGEHVELTQTIAGRRRMAAGERFAVVEPHRHASVLGTSANATDADVADAVAAAQSAAPGWAALPFDERAAVFLRAADLLAGPWRDTINAATMLGQSKSVQQAEIDSACELIDFLRFNVHYARRVIAEQPRSAPGEWNRMDWRPLDGFVTAITPFNFTAIAGNLPTVPALMGNTVVWKPTPTQQVAAHHTMRLLEAAGLPAGVINMVTGDGLAVSRVALTDPDLAGLHFTGSSATFKTLWRTIADNLDRYRSYPRIVGETGGKDFVVVHPSADPAPLTTALVRGAFEYQGQKCSAASRAYVPRSIWQGGLRDELADVTRSLRYGDVTDLTNFGGAVIDARAFDRHRRALDRAKQAPSLEILAGGGTDDSEGWFVDPTVLVGTDPADEAFATEYFGPILAVHVYDDSEYAATLDLVDRTSPYALTGAVFATDRSAVEQAHRALRHAAGNFYINDRPTGSIVSRQPFGGSRASGTNDKAGSMLNVQRWTSPRAIKETFDAPVGHTYPHQLS